MDQLVKHFFSDFSAPGAEFAPTTGGAIQTYYKGMLQVESEGYIQNRPYTSTQPMTPLGRMRCNLVGAPSSLDGLTKNFLTPEGTINLTVLADTLKSQAGMATPIWSAHVGMMGHWSWADNQTSLLVNMLRFTLLRRMTAEVGDNLNGALGVYADGHVQIDLDQFFDAGYPRLNAWEWPGGTAEANYPAYTRIQGYYPGNDGDCVDLRSLTQSEARFVLLMLGAWNRRSRYRLDFSSDRLIDDVMYRFEADVEGLNSWLAAPPGATGERRVEPTAPPPLPTWRQAWVALRKYVTQNRLYGHFSTALYLVTGAAYQFKPVTAESVWWLGCDWTIAMPQFRAIRGRYPALNEGEAALISHRSLAEWGFINTQLERINLIALVFSQAYHTGIAVRANRRGLEEDPADVLTTEGEFYRAETFLSAAASEAARIPIPLSGMSNVYIHCAENFETYDTSRVVVTMLDNGDQKPPGYAWTRGGHALPISVAARTRYRREMAEALEAIAKARADREARAAEAGEGNAEQQGTARQEPPEPEIMMPREPQPEVRAALEVPWVPLAGVPTLLLPLSCFERTTPFSLGGELNKATTGVVGRQGWTVNWYVAWEYANLARICGYDVDHISDNREAGPKRFFAPNDVNMVWPVLRQPDTQEYPALINRQNQRERVFVNLPLVHTRFFNNALRYRTNITSRGVASAPFNDERTIAEYGGTFNMSGMMTTLTNVPEGVARLRGYISRTAANFQFAPDAQAGIIPPPEQGHDAPNA